MTRRAPAVTAENNRSKSRSASPARTSNAAKASNPDSIFVGKPLEVTEQMLVDFISEQIIQPRNTQRKWALITDQSANITLGREGQVLASLVLGMKGTKTGARGSDVSDGTEVKSCSRLDQLDTCKDCATAVARHETACPGCNGTSIRRNNDSKWLFSIKSEDDLRLLTETVPRVVLVLADYPHFETNDWETLRFRVFEIPNTARHGKFKELMDRYYRSIYLAHRANGKSTIAPKNLWPDKFQFFMTNPLLIFQATVTHASSKPRVIINQWVAPDADRASLPSENMPAKAAPTELAEWITRIPDTYLAQRFPGTTRGQLLAMSTAEQIAAIGHIDEEGRDYLDLRDTEKPVTARTPYQRTPSDR